MNQKFEYLSPVDDRGRIEWNIRAMMEEDLLNFCGHKIKITIERSRIKRSNAQNALFHLYVGMMSRALGYEFDEMKEIVKFKFLKTEHVDESTGECLTFIRPTHLLTRSEFVDFIDSMVRWSGQLGVILPPPTQYGYQYADDPVPGAETDHAAPGTVKTDENAPKSH